MSTTTLQFTFTVDGAPADASAVVLRDPTSAYGVKRTDTSAVVVAAGTAMTHAGTGQYSYTFTDPAPDLVYNYWVEVTYDGATYRFERNRSAAPAGPLPVYLSADDADELAGALPGLAAWKAATDDAKAAALRRATAEVEDAMPYQGRRYDPAQRLQFPRVAYDDDPARFTSALVPPLAGVGVLPTAGPVVVWDWDAAANAPAVPRDVLLAVLYQADSVLDGSREPRLTNQHDGVVYDLTGALAESYKLNTAPGVRTGLCRQAWLLMRKYRRRSGRIL